jgi:hypothetical protein
MKTRGLKTCGALVVGCFSSFGVNLNAEVVISPVLRYIHPDISLHAWKQTLRTEFLSGYIEPYLLYHSD